MGSRGRPGVPTGLEATGTSVYTRRRGYAHRLTCIQVGEGLEGFWLTRESAQSPALPRAGRPPGLQPLITASRRF